MISIETKDMDEAVGAVGSVYCPHELHVDPRARALATRLQADAGGGLPLVNLEYGARVQVDAGSLNGLTLVMHSTRGTGTVRQRGHESRWSGGHTVVVSGNQSTQFEFDPMFAQSSLRLDPVEIRTHCEQVTGLSLDGDVLFDLTRFSPEMESMWSQVLALAFQRAGLPPTGAEYLKKLALDLLVYRCGHNYSHLFASKTRSIPRLAKEAIALIDSLEDHELLTVTDVAARLSVSVRSLERAFSEALDTGPAQYLRGLRLDRVRRQIESAPRGTSITDLAVAHGFYHPGRFAKYYRDRYGESPSSTLARLSIGAPAS